MSYINKYDRHHKKCGTREQFLAETLVPVVGMLNEYSFLIKHKFKYYFYFDMSHQTMKNRMMLNSRCLGSSCQEFENKNVLTNSFNIIFI